ncbi:MAG TPA: DOPA 4,5-dioxygenase family protein [Candidatus Binataceae bacterium]|nr:DOPA 4,5-dioxygenase family protein [Candidatus Binataceae bacterium]
MAQEAASGVRDPAIIRGYHAHVYFNPDQVETAAKIRQLVAGAFPLARLGGWRPQPVGPHPKAMYLIEFKPDEFARIIPWLMLNRSGLTVMVHPFTDDGGQDHSANTLWLGEQFQLKTEGL